ncbi:hypothetical protein TrRE_jg3271 [Triparma retinervis]|uniref:GTP-binding protein Obg n=1 Tax=Triparma retinervis TaxID=2557542 RepID=A0A9W7DYV8_9STRA|nr:hypothetical protein TrRE_jg3271 [Triparma retinervis]
MSVWGGPGGDGCVSFRREKGEPMGGPSGGSGGRGGHVILECQEGINTLAGARERVHVKGGKGENGKGKSLDGSRGRDITVTVPVGTVVRDFDGNVAGELTTKGQQMVVSLGGRGGRGNKSFKTNRNKAPKLAEKGGEGTQRWIFLELKLVGDVGVVGMPNAGKSTLLKQVTNANPKTADYPFTTISPNLGVVDLEDGKGLVLVDIPGLIEGASEGKGMGVTFLRHVQRNKVLLHVVDGSAEDPVGNFKKINRELESYDEDLGKKKQVVCVNKCDLFPDGGDDIIEQIREAAGHTRVLKISALHRENVKELMYRLKQFADAQPDVILDETASPKVRFDVDDLTADSDDFKVSSDPSYPGQWRVEGKYIEEVARMTHWDYPEAVERFSRVLEATGVAGVLDEMGAQEGDLIMIDRFDFDFAPSKTNPYIPIELLEQDAEILAREKMREEKELAWGRGESMGVGEEGEGADEEEEEGAFVMYYNLADEDDAGDDEDWEEDDEEMKAMLGDWSAFEGKGEFIAKEGDNVSIL